MNLRSAWSHVLNAPEFNVVLFALLLNLPWEFAQIPLYEGMGRMTHWDGVRICMRATGGDAVIALGAFGVAAVVAGSRRWVFAPHVPQLAAFMLTGLVVTILIEFAATRSWGVFDWRYTPSMPVVPIIGTGLAPLMQWIIVPPLVLWFVRRQIRQT